LHQIVAENGTSSNAIQAELNVLNKDNEK